MGIEQADQDERGGVMLPGLAVAVGGLATMGVHRGSLYPGGRMHDGMPLVWLASDGELFPGDYFVDALRQTPGYFWQMAGWLLGGEQVSHALYLVVPLLVAWLFSWGVYRLGRAVGLRGGYAALLVLCLCGRSESLTGMNLLTSGYFLPGATAAAVLMHALAFCVAGRWALGFGLVGLSANIHPLNAFYVGGIAAAACLPLVVNDGLVPGTLRQRWARFAGGLALALVGAAPMLVGMAMAPRGEIPRDWAWQIRESHLIHYYLFDQFWPLIFLLVSFLAMALALMFFRLPAGERRVRLFLSGYCGGLLWIMLVAGSIGSDVLEIPLVIKVQPLRASAWLVPMVVAALVLLLQHLNDAAPADRVARTRWHVVVGLLAICFAYYCWRPHYSPVGVMLLAVLAILIIALWLGEKQLAGVTTSRVLCALSVGPMVYVMVTACSLWLEVFTGMVFWTLSWGWFGLVVGATMAVWFVWVREGDTRRGLGWLAGLYFAGVLSAVMIPLYYKRPLLDAPSRDLLEAAQWVRDNTPRDAVVQGMPTSGGLRTWTRRPVYFESGDDHALYLKPDLLGEYLRRARQLGVSLKDKYDGGGEWSPAAMDLASLRDARAFDYLLLPGARDWPFERVYSNGRYTVYATGWRAE